MLPTGSTPLGNPQYLNPSENIEPKSGTFTTARGIAPLYSSLAVGKQRNDVSDPMG